MDAIEDTVNIKGLNYANKLWSRFSNNTRKLPNAFQLKLDKYGFYETDNQNERLKIALDVLETYSVSTAEKYFAYLKYGQFIDLPNIKNYFLARNYFGSIQKRTPQVRITSIQQYTQFISYLNNKINEYQDYKFSTNLYQYNKKFGAIVAIMLAANTGLRISELLRITNKHLRLLLDGASTIELKMKTSHEWKVIRHASFTHLLQKMNKMFYHFLQLSLETKLFNFSQEFLRLKLKYFFTIANNNQAPPKGFGLHTIRYVIASELSSINLKMAQEFLSHKQISTTNQYVRYKTIKLQNALTQLESQSTLYTEAKSIIS